MALGEQSSGLRTSELSRRHCTRVMRTFVGGCGGVAVPLAGTTNSVTLCAGSVATMLLPLSARSARRVMVLADVSCQACAVPRCVKFARLIVAGVVPDRCLLIDHDRQSAVG